MTTPHAWAVPRQLALVVALFVGIVGCLLVVSSAQLEIMSGVRAYVGGESAWSKGQKDAAYHLLRYALSHDAREYDRYRSAIAVPLGDRAARRQLERPPSARDLDARRGFLAGRIHPDDVPIMMQLFRRFRHVSYMSDAVDIWRRADDDIGRLERVADRLHAAIVAEDSPSERLGPLLRKLDVLNTRLTPLAESFSTTLGTGARALRTILMRTGLVATLALVLAGIAISWMIFRRIRHADAALRGSEERYRDLFDNASDLVYTHDLEGTIRSVNGAATRLTGYTAAEANGLNIGRLVAPEFVVLAREMIARKLAGGGTSVYELEIVAKHGRRIPLEVSTRLVYERGRPVGVHGIARDISDRKRTEAAFAREAHTSAALARAGRELISALETPVVLERLCQLATDLLDCPAGETLLCDGAADTFTTVARVGAGADDWPPGMRSRAALAALFGDADVAEPVPGRLAMALRRGGELVGVQVVRAGATAPITPERWRIAEGMAQVASLSLANAHLVAELARASRLKSEFVSTMSHELRTPLNVILGYAEMARETAAPTDRAECLRRVELAARDLLELIETTLEVGRIDAGRDAVRLEPVALDEFLSALGERCARLPRRSGVDFVWDDQVPTCVVTTDPRKLTVVLRNLIGNALKFTERGSVRVDVTVTTESIVIRVADTGIGIRPEDQASIFEIFRQADGSDTRRFGGTGLGLYLVRRFVDQLGGRIELVSELGRGAAFTVTLPRAVPAAVSRAA